MSNFIQTVRQLGPARLAIMGSVLVGLLLFFIFVSMRMATPQFSLLYDGLSTTDSSSMGEKLSASDIKFEVSPDGTRIMVPQVDVGRARMLLAKDGLPNGGTMGYELFDKQSGFGTTNFVQNINQVRALEGELSRTISSLESIRSARVHLVLPQRELFSRDARPASASVFLTLKSNVPISSEQIAAIQSLVSSSVANLKASHVSIIDSAGNLLARGGDEDAGLMPMKTEELRRSYETRTTQTIEDMVGRIVGYGKVRANVTVDMDFDQVSTNEEIYDPNGQVARSTQTTEETGSETTGQAGDVSVQNNLPGIAGDLGGAGPTSQNNKTEETTNFEISKTVRTSQRQIGTLKHLSVAVLVDGSYTTDKEGNKTYQPRSQEELDRISALVKSAVGFDDKRGDSIEVANMQFADIAEETGPIDDGKLFGFERADLLNAAEVITVTIMIILVILLVIQPMVGRLLATEEGMDEGLETELLAAKSPTPALTGPASNAPMAEEEESLIDMSRVEGKVKASSVKKVEDIVTNYPNETVSVLRGWMTQES